MSREEYCGMTMSSSTSKPSFILITVIMRDVGAVFRNILRFPAHGAVPYGFLDSRSTRRQNSDCPNCNISAALNTSATFVKNVAPWKSLSYVKARTRYTEVPYKQEGVFYLGIIAKVVIVDILVLNPGTESFRTQIAIRHRTNSFDNTDELSADSKRLKYFLNYGK